MKRQHHRRSWICALVCCLMAVACAPHLDLGDSAPELTQKSQDGSSEPSGIYPIAEVLHYENGEGAIGQRPVVSNAVAYARYAVDLLGGWARETEDAAEIGRSLAQIAHESAVLFQDGRRYFETEPSLADEERYWEEILADARSMSSSQLPRQGQELVAGRTRLAHCVQDGYGVVDCCASLAWFEGVYRSSMDRFTEESFGTDPDYRAITNLILDEQIEEIHSGERGSLQPFSHGGLRTWLGYCGGAVTGAPRSLSEFVFQYGDYRNDADWVIELHPISPAKQAGRRIYRRRIEGGLSVSVAESIEDDCTVRETETIVMREGRQAEFWVFDHHGTRVEHAYFPTPRPHEDTVRFAPSTCMGCHYTFDTRRFNVAAPSFHALNLSLFEKDGQPVWRDHTACADEGETLIYHDAPTISR